MTSIAKTSLLSIFDACIWALLHPRRVPQINPKQAPKTKSRPKRRSRPLSPTTSSASTSLSITRYASHLLPLRVLSAARSLKATAHGRNALSAWEGILATGPESETPPYIRVKAGLRQAPTTSSSIGCSRSACCFKLPRASWTLCDQMSRGGYQEAKNRIGKVKAEQLVISFSVSFFSH